MRLYIETAIKDKEGKLRMDKSQTKYIIAGIIIVCIGILTIINAAIHKDVSDILIGFAFMLIGGIYIKKQK